jgi:uncharacterized protein YebE (UPF0316 family)
MLREIGKYPKQDFNESLIDVCKSYFMYQIWESKSLIASNMDNLLLLNSGFYTWLVLPALIFLARIIDVSMGTIRVIFVSRGFKYLAPIVGFFEILIWLLAIGQIMKNLSNPMCYLAYAGGFAMGNFVGIHIAEKLSLGVVMIRVVTNQDATPLVDCLKAEEYGVTSVDGHGTSGQVKVIFTIVQRRDVRSVVELIKKFNPQAFYSIEEVRVVEKGVFRARKSWHNFDFSGFFRPFRKGK